MTRYANALVLGLGASGEAAARLLRGEGAAVTVLDEGSGEALESRAAALRRDGVRVETGFGAGARTHEERAQVLAGLAGAGGAGWDVCVLSPGVPADAPWVEAVRARGIPVIPELELGWSRCGAPLLAVTGSNGKSTLTKFCAEILATCGRRVEAGANFGTPLSALAARGRADWIVAEVSSFQLETTSCFRPRIAILLNLAPNHLDRHRTMEAYAAAKLRLFRFMEAGDLAVVPPAFAGRLGPCRAEVVSFGAEAGADFAYANGRIQSSRCRDVDVRGTVFESPALGLSASAALAAALAAGCPPEAVEAAARAFRPLAHRMERIGEFRGVTFIDDSKATNLGAVHAALESCAGRVRLIAGGLLKETDLSGVEELLVKKVAAVYVIGRDGPVLKRAWEKRVPCRESGTLEAAVQEAWSEAGEGDIILLSPACASFDQFKSYAERGNRFRRIFANIRGEE